MKTGLRFLVTAVGGVGDLSPLLTIAQELKHLGHEALVIAPSRYEALVESCGLRFSPVSGSLEPGCRDADKWLLSTRYSGLWQKRHGVDLNEKLYRELRNMSDGNTMILAANRSYLWADFYAYCHCHIPAVRFAIDPPPCIKRPELPAGAVIRRLDISWRAKWATSCHSLGLGGNTSCLGRLLRFVAREIPIVPLYPSWLVGADTGGDLDTAKPSFVPTPVVTESNIAMMSASRPSRPVIAFVAGTHGTTSGWDDRFFRISAAICNAVNCNGYLVGGQRPAEADPQRIRWQPFFAVGEILKVSRVIVHEGEMDIAAAAMDAGVHQIVIPRTFTQSSNARWLADLGVAGVIEPAGHSPDRVAHILKDSLREDTAKPVRTPFVGKCFSKSYLTGLCVSLSAVMSPAIETRPRPNRAARVSHGHLPSGGHSHDAFPMYLLCGLPAVGKSTFARWMARNHGFVNIDAEKRGELQRLGLARDWRGMARQDWNAVAFVKRMQEFSKPVIIDWPCLPACMSLVRQMQDAGIRVWWFGGDPAAARQAYIDRGRDDVRRFDRQIVLIREMQEEINALVGSRSLNMLEPTGRRLSNEDIFARLMDDSAGHAPSV